MSSASLVLGICFALEAGLGNADSSSLTSGKEGGNVHQARVAASVFLPTDTFTLAWTHSIEKQRWEEDYRVTQTKPPGTTQDNPLLLPGLSRVKGSGAGMEPGPDSRLTDGWYTYQPVRMPLKSLRLSRSFFTDDYSLCIAGNCRLMSEVLPSDGGVTLLWACEKNSTESPP
jgi:hypothetical protein